MRARTHTRTPTMTGTAPSRSESMQGHPHRTRGVCGTPPVLRGFDVLRNYFKKKERVVCNCIVCKCNEIVLREANCTAATQTSTLTTGLRDGDIE